MATTSAYKEYQRLARIMTVEDLFNLGMSYVDTPLEEGFAKLLVNYDLKNQGTSLTPRGGFKCLNSNLGASASDGNFNGWNYAIHHVGTTLVASYDGANASLHKYVLIAQTTPQGHLDLPCFFWQNVRCYVEVDGDYKLAAWVPGAQGLTFSLISPRLQQAHRSTIDQNYGCVNGTYISLEGNTYIPMWNSSSSYMFGRLALKFTTALESVITCELIPLTPKEIPAAQVINTGYNMLKSNPYDFPNTVNATGAFTLEGIIPKDAYSGIKLTADVGEVIYYHLNYTYPVEQAPFVVQWEINNLNNNATTQVLSSALTSDVYTAGEPVKLIHTVAYKQYTIIAKVFLASDVTAYKSAVTTLALEDAYPPIKAITVSSYYTTADESRKTSNLTARKFDVAHCNGACVWQQRAVVWGVADAPTTLFISQPNLPEYFPYPNNVELFAEEIVSCVPFLTDLLVFTATKIYKLAMATNGISTYCTTKCIQEGLPMSVEDSSTIRIVKNMVYFKSGNYFYMIVPNNNAGAGELQLAPVSRPIEELLDSFKETVTSVLGTLWDMDGLLAPNVWALTFTNYSNHLDGATIKNVYKCKIVISTPEGVHVNTRYIDFVLNYDTVSRAWTVHTYEAPMHPLVVYENTVTNGTQFVSILLGSPIDITGANLTVPVGLGLFTFDVLSPKDEADIYIGSGGVLRLFNNYQLLDTGYRSHFSTHKKRFREIQFSINNTAKDVLHFYTSFTLDDDVRKDLYTYEVQHITDPLDPNYGLVYVERSLVESTVPGVLTLDEDDGWALDFAQFENITVAKVRYKVSGKGYNGKIQILSMNEAPYELLSTNWVYRKMNGR